MPRYGCEVVTVLLEDARIYVLLKLYTGVTTRRLTYHKRFHTNHRQLVNKIGGDRPWQVNLFMIHLEYNAGRKVIDLLINETQFVVAMLSIHPLQARSLG